MLLRKPRSFDGVEARRNLASRSASKYLSVKYVFSLGQGIDMDSRFAAFVERLHPAYIKLLLRKPVSGGELPDYGAGELAARRGVYLFTEGGKHLYVGRSN